jgi:hypothetical protein
MRKALHTAVMINVSSQACTRIEYHVNQSGPYYSRRVRFGSMLSIKSAAGSAWLLRVEVALAFIRT